MRKKHRYARLIAVFLLLLSVCQIFSINKNIVYGEVNSEYAEIETSKPIDVNKAVSDSDELVAIAEFIYAIAGFLEKTVGKIIGNFTGNNMFPWADKIIFNAIPFLDINFINPSSGSMFESQSSSPGENGVMTVFGTIIGNMYYTIFAVAISFLGIIVGIMSIKLAISTIASEKAKYKSAIQNWLLALILVFTSHYLISFIFFVNEKMVEVASTLLSNQIKNISYDINILSWSDDELQHLVNLLSDNATGSGETTTFTNAYGTISCGISKGKIFLMGYIVGENSNTGTWVNEKGESVQNEFGAINTNSPEDVPEIIKKLNKNICLLLTTPEYIECQPFYDYATHGDLSNIGENITNFLAGWSGAQDIMPIVRHASMLALEEMRKEKSSSSITLTEDQFFYNLYGETKTIIQSKVNDDNYLINTASTRFLKEGSILYNLYNNNVVNTSGTTIKKSIFTNMSTFFKNSIYSFKKDKDGNIDSASASEFQVIPAILYSIFVIQSIMYFIAYMKRFFYIIILALFAPLVIIYDFFTKSVAT